MPVQWRPYKHYHWKNVSVADAPAGSLSYGGWCVSVQRLTLWALLSSIREARLMFSCPSSSVVHVPRTQLSLCATCVLLQWMCLCGLLKWLPLGTRTALLPTACLFSLPSSSRLLLCVSRHVAQFSCATHSKWLA